MTGTSSRFRDADGGYPNDRSAALPFAPGNPPGATPDFRSGALRGSGADRAPDRRPQRCRELGASLEVELAEHVGEVAFDGTGGDEQVLGDLTVGQPFGGKLGDAALAGGESLQPAELHPSRPGARRAQLGLGPV